MVTLEEVKQLYSEYENASEWAHKWSPYALHELEKEYQSILHAYAKQEHTTIHEVIKKISS